MTKMLTGVYVQSSIPRSLSTLFLLTDIYSIQGFENALELAYFKLSMIMWRSGRASIIDVPVLLPAECMSSRKCAWKLTRAVRWQLPAALRPLTTRTSCAKWLVLSQAIYRDEVYVTGRM